MSIYKKIGVGKGSFYTMYEHQMVWMKAHGDVPEGMVIDHINGNKRDNRLENLQVVKHQYNTQRSVSGGFSWSDLKQKWIARRQLNGKRVTKHFGTPGGAKMFINTCLLGGLTCAV